MRRKIGLLRSNTRLARNCWAGLPAEALTYLADLTERHSLSIGAGHLRMLDGRWFITNAGLLHIAQRRGCVGIKTILLRVYSDPNQSCWVFKAIVFKTRGSKGFEGYGDANPSNVSSMVHGAEMRVAETRAVNRALRRPMGLVSARSRSWVHCLSHSSLRNRSIPPVATAQTTVSPDSATNSAC